MSEQSLIDKVVLGRYRVVRKIARGGMGTIYLGRSEGAAGFVKPVVIKRIHSDLDHELDRNTGLFIREAMLLATIRHPDVVSVIDFGTEDDAYVMVLEYIHGFHLGQWARYLRRKKRTMPADTAIHITIRILDALEYAHNVPMSDGSHGCIVHRDVTPSNVLLDVNGYLKLADFGIASANTGKGEAMTMNTSQVRGKLSYIAPELFNGEQPAPQTDIYSCGVLLHELLVGRNEFVQREDAATIHRVLHHNATPVSAVRDDVADELDDVLVKALAKEPSERYRTAAEFARDLRKCLTVGEAEARSQMMRQVSQDFRGDIAEVLGTTALSDLEHAWTETRSDTEEPSLRSLSDSPPAAEEVTKVAEYEELDEEVTLTPDTVVGTGPKVPPPPPLSSSPGLGSEAPDAGRRWLVPALSVLALLLAVGAFATVQLRSEPPPVAGPSRYIVVEGEGHQAATPGGGDEAAPAANAEGATQSAAPAGAEGEAATPEGDAPAEAEASASTMRPVRRTTTRPPADDPQARARALTRAFGRQRTRVQACFTEHAESVTGRPRVQVRFSIDASGAVERASLEPAALEGTALGRCLLQVARGTRFGPQPGPATFAIPVTATTR